MKSPSVLFAIPLLAVGPMRASEPVTKAGTPAELRVVTESEVAEAERKLLAAKARLAELQALRKKALADGGDGPMHQLQAQPNVRPRPQIPQDPIRIDAKRPESSNRSRANQPAEPARTTAPQ